MKKIFCLMALILPFALGGDRGENLAGSTQKGEWAIEVVDPSVNSRNALALDGQDRPHIAYGYGPGPKYAYFDGAQWQYQSVANDTASHFDIAIDKGGHQHISYASYANYLFALAYAHFDGSSWHTEVVDSDGYVGEYSSIAVDSRGFPHIAYGEDYNYKDLRYASFDGQQWNIEVVDQRGDVGSSPSLALDLQDLPHISYWDRTKTNLKYAFFDGTAWQFQVVDTRWPKGYFTSLALDPQGRPHIGYYDILWANLRYAHFDGSSWSLEVVDRQGNVGWWPSLAVDSNGHPHISYSYYYEDAGTAGLKYTFLDGLSWSFETVEEGIGVGYFNSLAVDSKGTPHISYSSDAGIKYAYRRTNQTFLAAQ